ncbi:MAG: DUF2703 domain-containing protein [Candidatus Hydrothermarchaeales archaeon]
MKIELLYFDDCPNYKKTLEDVNELLKQEGVEAEIAMIRIETQEEAEKLGFLGSPTLRIAGKDVDEKSRDSKEFGLKCRIYLVGDKILGSPPREMIMQTLKEAKV